MKYRKLGKTGVSVSEISLGCATIGDREVEENDAITAVRYAVDNGVNHFDTADAYGNGRSERILGKAVTGLDQDIIIASKTGNFKGTAGHQYEPGHIRQQCEQTLRNLKRECIDLYYFHNTDFGENDRYLDAAVETMQDLDEETDGVMIHTYIIWYDEEKDF